MASLKQWKLYSIKPCLSKTSSLKRQTKARNLLHNVKISQLCGGVHYMFDHPNLVCLNNYPYALLGQTEVSHAQ